LLNLPTAELLGTDENAGALQPVLRFFSSMLTQDCRASSRYKQPEVLEVLLPRRLPHVLAAFANDRDVYRRIVFFQPIVNLLLHGKSQNYN